MVLCRWLHFPRASLRSGWRLGDPEVSSNQRPEVGTVEPRPLEEILDSPDVPLGSAEVEARKVISRILADDQGRITLPVDPHRVAAGLGIDVVERRLKKDTSGAISKDPGNRSATAVVNSRDPKNRRRFTLAHEIGHFVKGVREDGPEAPKGKVEWRDETSSWGTDPEERFANTFAAALLMPRRAVGGFWARGLSLPDMAKTFGVSESSMNFRLINLGLK